MSHWLKARPMRTVQASACILIAALAFAFAADSLPMNIFGLVGTISAHAQPIEEEEEEVGARSPLSGKGDLNRLRDGRRALQPTTRPRTGTRPRDHRGTSRGFRGSGGVAVQVRKSGVAYATTSLKCDDGTVYEVSTGNDQGACGSIEGTADCDDGEGNKARATCKEGCGTIAGSGSCKIKQ